MAILKLKSELDLEPAFSGGQNEVGSGVEQCPLSEKAQRKRITEVYFTNKEGERIEKITKEEKVDMVIKTQNMAGDEIKIDLPSIASSFKLNGEQVTDAKVIVHKVASDKEKVELEIVPTKVDVVPKPRSGSTARTVVVESNAQEVDKIITCEFLDGPNENVLQGNSTQYVNLPRDAKWVDNELMQNADRLDYMPWILIKFNTKKRHKFFLKWVPENSNVEYTPTEKSRNTKFDYCLSETEYVTEGNGEVIIKDFALSVAGSDKFKVQARDENNVVANCQGVLETKRLIYTVGLKMKGLENCTPNIANVKKEFKRSGIIVKSFDDNEMEYMQNISKDDETTFIQNAKKAFNTSQGKAKNENCLAIAYTEHLAVKVSDKKFKLKVKVGPGETKVTFNIEGPGITDPTVNQRALWRNIVTDEDWFISCSYWSSDDKLTKVTIPKSKCTPVQKPKYWIGYMDRVDVDVSHLPKGNGILVLKVNWVDRMRGGLAFLGSNLVCVCTKAYWTDMSADQQEQVIIHEIGHKVQMSSTGLGSSPDKISTHYDKSKGHKGNHCYKGNADNQERYDSHSDNQNSTCVMYGATNGKMEFCSNCQPALQRVDLTSGWQSF